MKALVFRASPCFYTHYPHSAVRPTFNWKNNINSEKRFHKEQLVHQLKNTRTEITRSYKAPPR